MSSYKLNYFNISGLGEPIRFLLSYGGVDFEDNRINREDWPKFKPLAPLEQVPTLEIDGKTLYQSNSIIRFLAKKFGVNGSNDFEAFEVDAVIETINDMRQVLAKWFFYSEESQRAATKEETFKKAEFFLTKLESTAKKNGGYFVGGTLSAADIVFAGFNNTFNHIVGKDFVADYPTLSSIVEKVTAEPKIKAYIEQRPKTDF